MTEPSHGDTPRDELHAYVDGQLPPERRRAVEAWLADNPAMAATVAGWKAQNDGIRALYAAEVPADRIADGRELHTLRARLARPRPRWRMAAAAVAIFALGGVSGGLLDRALQGTPPTGAPSLPQLSLDSYLVYAGEVRHPVEVGADQEAHLVGWLGKRLGTALSAPDLSRLGFRLVGGRLVPVGDAPGAMLMYEDAGGKRLTCLIARDPASAADTGFRYAEHDGVATFSWVDHGLGYALSAPFARERLLEIANAVYGQI